MRTYLLDTSVIIDFLRGKDQAVDLVNELDGSIVSSYICLGELYEGVYRSTNKNTHEESVINFFKHLTHIMSIDEETAIRFGEIRAHLKQSGTIIEDLDLLIAATCIVHNLELVTFNTKHFSRIKALRIYQMK